MIRNARWMRRASPMLVVCAFVVVGCAWAAAAFFVIPGRLVDDARFDDAASNAATEEKRLKARNDVRTVGVQLVGALALIVGGALTWRTVWLTREGQITDRLTKAIEQLGEHEKTSVRVGAIHALGRVARDSRVDHPAVMAILGEHLRASHPAVDETGEPLAARRGVDPEVRAVAMVLRARRPRWDPEQPQLNFSRIDFRNAPLQGVDLKATDLRQSNFRGAYLSDADLTDAQLTRATLSGASLQRCKLKGARLAGADLRYAHAEKACLRSAELDEVLWQNTELQGADLRAAKGIPQTLREARDPKLVIFDKRTKWPAIQD
jgi:pentapeptide repeat protein